VGVGGGINVRGPVAAAVRETAIALADVAQDVTRPGLLAALAAQLWPLAARPAALDEAEREAFVAMHWSEPGVPATVVGVDGEGALLSRRGDGSLDRRVVPL
jgi:hypothetical protein